MKTTEHGGAGRTTAWASWLYAGAIGAGGLTTLLGLVVIVGWQTNNVTLVQVLPTFVPMQFNTALGFVLCGLGLPISRRFCRMMGGDISVTSELGVGSTFSIELPVQIDALEAAKASAPVDDEKTGEVSADDRPVLMITAKDLTEDERLRLVGGVERIVEKGALARPQLLETVRELVAKYREKP